MKSKLFQLDDFARIHSSAFMSLALTPTVNNLSPHLQATSTNLSVSLPSSSSSASSSTSPSTSTIPLTDDLLESFIWDQWLCCLATSLSPAQWQLYWMNYLSLFGTIGLPQHLVDFFTNAINSTPINDHRRLNWCPEKQFIYGL